MAFALNIEHNVLITISVVWSALWPFLINLSLKTFQVMQSCYVLTLHINIHLCRAHSTSVVCSAHVFSSLSSVDVSDVQWVSFDMLTSCDVCPQYSWRRNTCSHITVQLHIVTFFDNSIFGLFHRCRNCKTQSNVLIKLPCITKH